MNKKVVNGDYLLNLGFKSGKWFKEAINHINKNQLSDEEMEHELKCKGVKVPF